jgi:DNA (cytosine-5)-methyltransferase 1
MDNIGGKCVFTSEWDKACRMTYQANYESCREHKFVGDIRDVTKDEEALATIPDHDLLVAGFPCQPFSIAGVSKKNALGRAHGFRCDAQGTLFFDLAQIIEFHRPKAILLENVKNLVSHDKGKTFTVIRRTLEEELGYTIDYRVIDGRGWVPQHRERIIIVGFKKDVDFSFKDFHFPEKEEHPVLGSILHREDSYEEDEAPFLEGGKVGEKYTLTPRLWEYLQGYKKKHQAKGNGFGYSLFGPEDVARTLSARYYKDGSEILIRQEGKRPRRLTPRECARIMGFDGPGESNFKIPVSDTQAYKQFGNSVIVPMAEAVARHMKPYLKEAIRITNNQMEIPFEKAETA